jgi:hypothetical protein
MASIAVLALLWAVVVWRFPALRQASWKRAPWIALAALALALSVSLPVASPAVDRAVGVADFSQLVKHVCAVIAAAAFLDWMSVLADPGHRKHLAARRPAAGLAIASMIALFIVTRRPETTSYTAAITGGTAVAYLMIMYLYLGAALAVAAPVFARAARVSPGGTLRWGLRFLAAGSAFGTGFAAWMTCCLLLRVSGADTGVLLADGNAAQNAAIALILAGMCVPAFGVAWQAMRDLASLHALRGIWKELTDAIPAVSAGPVRRGPAAAVRSARIRLIRRTAEIRDAALALRCYVPPGTVDEARRRLASLGLSGPALDAAAEACWLLLAIRAMTAGAPASEPSHRLPGGDTLRDEVRWLRKVSAAIRLPQAAAVADGIAGGRARATGRLRTVAAQAPTEEKSLAKHLMAITVKWKISLHCAVSSGATVMLALTWGAPWLACYALIGLVAWSRAELKDHTSRPGGGRDRARRGQRAYLSRTPVILRALLTRPQDHRLRFCQLSKSLGLTEV